MTKARAETWCYVCHTRIQLPLYLVPATDDVVHGSFACLDCQDMEPAESREDAREYRRQFKENAS